MPYGEKIAKADIEKGNIFQHLSYTNLCAFYYFSQSYSISYFFLYLISPIHPSFSITKRINNFNHAYLNFR